MDGIDPNLFSPRETKFRYVVFSDSTGVIVGADNKEIDKIHVDGDWVSSRSWATAIKLDHPHYVCCLFADSVNYATVHLKYDHTLEDHIKGMDAIKTYKGSIDYVSYLFRRLTRGMISIICDLHLNGESLDLRGGSLGIENFVIGGDGIVKLWKVDFIKADNYSRARDFSNLHDVLIKPELFGNYAQRHFNHLLNLMFEYERYVDHSEINKLMSHHLAIMPSKERTMFIRGCHEKVVLLRPDCFRKYENAVKLIPVRDWFKMLKATQLPPLQGFNNSPKAMTRVARGSKGSWDLLKVCRQIVAYLGEHFSGLDYDDKDIDHAINSVFGVDLAAFQLELCHQGLLSMFL